MTNVSTLPDISSPQVIKPVKAKSGFIIGPIADSVLIIGAPIVALLIAAPLFASPSSYFAATYKGQPQDLRQCFIMTFINAHLFLVYFRTHANEDIFRMYPMRFVAVPLILIVAGAVSPVILAIMGIVGVWWDVYHSSMQTFGFGRIYDAKQKNDADVGRSLDYWMNLLVYTGPILAGAHFIDHLKNCVGDLQTLAIQGSFFNEVFAQRTPDFLGKYQTHIAVAILTVGVPFALYYLYSYYRFQQQGYRISWQKVWLLLITTTVSIYCWGFRSFIDAFWVMNFFHALQYFAIVSFAEKRNLAELFRVGHYSHGWMVAVFWVVSFSFVYGFWSNYLAENSWSHSMALTTSLMHFWYDGFVWSVKKKQV